MKKKACIIDIKKYSGKILKGKLRDFLHVS